MKEGVYLYPTDKLMETDKFGNALYVRVFESPHQTHMYGLLSLKLLSEDRPRQIGYIDFKKGVYYCTRDSSKHYHYKSKGYGFNWSVIENDVFKIKTICLDIDHENTYIFPVELLRNHGRVLNFKKQGFELQKFLAFELIKPHKTHEQTTICLDKIK